MGNRLLRRHVVEDYTFQLGRYHSARTASVRFYWAVPELEIWYEIGSSRGNIEPTLRIVEVMAKNKLLNLESLNKDHPLPLSSRSRNMSPENETISVPIAAKLLKTSSTTIRRYIRSGALIAAGGSVGRKRHRNFRITLGSFLEFQRGLFPQTEPKSTAMDRVLRSPTVQGSPQKPPRDLIRASQAAMIAGVSRRTIYRMFKDGKILGYKITPREIRYSESDIRNHFNLRIGEK